MKLHGYWRSSASWRVRIALHTKGVVFDTVPVHLVRDGGEQHAAQHRSLNPLAQVPALVLDDGRTLTQSLAIIEYLEETHPSPPLLPADPWARAKCRQLAELVNSGIQPLQNLDTLAKVASLGGDKSAWASTAIERGLDAYAELSRECRGRFSVGDAVSIADLCLIPQIYNARRFGLEIERWQPLIDIEARCEQLPAFHAAHPNQQIDAQPGQ